MDDSKLETAKPQDCLLVLGMHRSGTSALAGVLSLLGCATPASLIRGDADNEKGYYESNAVGRLSDSILAELDTGWNDWVPVDTDDLPRKQYGQYRDLICQTITEDFEDAPLFVLKEPRMCRMVPLWREALQHGGCRVCAVHTHRNPIEVAASLARRDGFEQVFSLLLWMRHVLDAEIGTRGEPRVFTSYRHLMHDWRAVIQRLTNGLELPFKNDQPDTDKAVDEFLSARLQHFRKPAEDTLSDPALPENVRSVFAIMENWAENGEREDDYATLDALRADLNAQAAIFAPLTRPGQMAMLALPAVRSELQDITARRDELESALAQETQGLITARDELAAKNAEIDDLTRELQNKNLKLEQQAEALDRLRTDLSSKDAELVTANNQIQMQQQTIDDDARTLEELHMDQARLQGALKQAQQDIHTVLGSTSWRVTAPLRNVSRLLRRS